MKKSLIVLAVATLALAGCGAPEKDVKYETINDFAAAYEDGMDEGVECRRTEIDINKSDWVYTHCDESVTLMMFTSDAKMDEVLLKNPLDDGGRWVKGPNWVIRAPQYEAEAAHEVFGGTLAVIP